jgi:hypothetical protein
LWVQNGLGDRVWRFKPSQDRAFAAKLRDVVKLYLDPPAHSLVLSVDEKSQIQALDRTQPGLPMKKGRAGTHLIEKWGVWIIIAKSLTPIPFKIMAIAAGVAAMSPLAFLIAAVVGRALHFAILAALIALWGDRVTRVESRGS